MSAPTASSEAVIDLTGLSHRRRQAEWPFRMRSTRRLEEVSGHDEDYNDAPPKKRQKKSPADDLICPITLELPLDPVMAEDGRVYEKSAIEKHFKSHADDGNLKSPMTNEKIGTKLLPAPQHRNTIETLVEIGVIGGYLASKWKEKVHNHKKMKDLLHKAEKGDGVAMFLVGDCYSYGSNGFEKDKKLALSWYTKAHYAGNNDGTAWLGYLLSSAEESPDITRGMMYLSMAAGKGSSMAAFELGMALAHGTLGMPMDKREAIHWLQKVPNDGSSYYASAEMTLRRLTQERVQNS